MQKQKYLGIELGGSKGNRTAVVALDYFPLEKKIFVRRLNADEEQEPDEALLALVNHEKPQGIGINAPLTMPPCINCDIKPCPGFSRCEVPAVKWMRKEAANLPGKVSTPYTQRPVDLLLRGAWQKEKSFVPADETLGAGRAPLAARIWYLKKHMEAPLLEVYPRLALAGISGWYGISDRELRLCRDVEVGVENRYFILEKIAGDRPVLPSIFLYNTDLALFAKDLPVFDALLCAMMALFQTLGFLEEFSWEESWGNIAKPKVEIPQISRHKPLDLGQKI